MARIVLREHRFFDTFKVELTDKVGVWGYDRGKHYFIPWDNVLYIEYMEEDGDEERERPRDLPRM